MRELRGGGGERERGGRSGGLGMGRCEMAGCTGRRGEGNSAKLVKVHPRVRLRGCTMPGASRATGGGGLSLRGCKMDGTKGGGGMRVTGCGIPGAPRTWGGGEKVALAGAARGVRGTERT